MSFEAATGSGRPAVFVDRDGTIIEDAEYLSDIRDLRPIPGASESLKRLRQAGFLVILVTNQSGVARGYFDEEFVRKTHQVLEGMLDFRFDSIYFCPHGPNQGCVCRKPATGMIDSAFRDLPIQREGSVVIGDKAADIELARNAGMPGILVRTGQGNQTIEVSPGFVAADINEACEWILNSGGPKSG